MSETPTPKSSYSKWSDFILLEQINLHGCCDLHEVLTMRLNEILASKGKKVVEVPSLKDFQEAMKCVDEFITKKNSEIATKQKLIDNENGILSKIFKDSAKSQENIKNFTNFIKERKTIIDTLTAFKKHCASITCYKI